MTFNKYEVTLLRKLYNYGYIGSKHTDSTNALRGFPRSKGREVNNALKSLIKKDYIWVYPSTGERHISLNNNKIAEIRKIIE